MAVHDGGGRHFVGKEMHTSGRIRDIKIKLVMQINKVIPDHARHALPHISPHVIKRQELIRS